MNRTNLFVDLGIFSAFLIAMEPRLTGVSIHEWLSVALAATVIAHLLLHWKWIVNVGGQFIKKLWHSSRLKFVVDSLLFVAFTGIMMSGIMISRSVVPFLGLQIQGGMAWRQLHVLTTDIGMLLVGLHFALSWNWVVTAVRRFILAPVAHLFRKPQFGPVAVEERH